MTSGRLGTLMRNSLIMQSSPAAGTATGGGGGGGTSRQPLSMFGCALALLVICVLFLSSWKCLIVVSLMVIFKGFVSDAGDPRGG